MVYAATNYNQPTIYKPQGMEGKTIFNDDIETFLESSKKVANNILSPKSSSTASNYTSAPCQPKTTNNVYVVNTAPSYPVFVPVSYGHHHSYHHHTTYNSYNSGFHHSGHVHSGGKHGEEGPGGLIRVLAGLAATVLGAVGIYFLGKNVANKDENEKELAKTKEFKAKLSVYKQECPNNGHLSKIEKIVDAKERVLAESNKSSFWNIALLIGAVASAALLLVGAVFAMAPLMAVGFLGAAAVGGCFLFKWAVSSKDTSTDDAIIIRNNVDELWNAKKPHLPPAQPVQAPVVVNMASTTSAAAQQVFVQPQVLPPTVAPTYPVYMQPAGLQPNTITVSFQIDPVVQTVNPEAGKSVAPQETVVKAVEIPAQVTIVKAVEIPSQAAVETAAASIMEQKEEKAPVKSKTIPTPPPPPPLSTAVKKKMVDALHPIRHEDKNNIGPHILKPAGAKA